MSEFDSLTSRLAVWAKRVALADGRRELRIVDFLCGLHALANDPSPVSELTALLPEKDGKTHWPEDVKALYEKAKNIPPDVARSEKIPFDAQLKQVIDKTHCRDSKMPLKVLVPVLLDHDDAAMASFRELNGIEKKSARAELVARIDRVRCDAKRVIELVREKVVGQDAAMRTLGKAYIHACLARSSSGPRGIITLLGPPGCGKTLSATVFAEALTVVEGGVCAFRRFDMGNYGGPQSHEGLFGVESFYKNSNPGALTGFVRENPRAVVLLDEIEKAHDNVHNALLAMLDRGESVDKNFDKPVSFCDAWIILTTNLGNEEYFGRENASGIVTGSGTLTPAALDILASARPRGAKRMPDTPAALAPEFVSRLAKGGAVVFAPLGQRELMEVVRRRIALATAGDGKTEPLPVLTVSDESNFLFLLTLLPVVDARRADARASAWASELISDSFDQCRDALLESGAETYEISVKPGQGASAYLQERQASFRARVLVIDRDQVVGQAIEQEFVDFGVTVSRKDPEADFTGVLGSANFNLALLDVSECATNPTADTDCNDLPFTALEHIRKVAPQLPVYLYCENPNARGGIDATVDRAVRHGGARGFIASRGTPDNPLVLDVFLDRIREILESERWAFVMRGIQRTNRTVSFRIDFQFDPSKRVVTGLMEGVSESVVVTAPDAAAAISFAGIPSERLDSVVGLARAKARLKQVLDWLRNPGALAAFGVNPPRGYLLAGPPGTGKTMLARALAGEAGAPFIALAAGELSSKFVGESEERIRDLFARARRYAPAIIFIDEIDTIGRRREMGGHTILPEHNAGMLNQLLACMDGFRPSDNPVFVLAATNFPEILDPALRRPGRFDETIPIDLPDAAARRRLLELRGWPSDAPELEAMVRRTAQCSPAQLDRMHREACYSAASRGATRPSFDDLEKARQLVLYGAADEDARNEPADLRLTAWHEAGHALASRRLMPHHKIDLLTVLPRADGSLGFMSLEDDDKRRTPTRGEIRSRIAVCLAGREAELLAAGSADGVTVGASEDLRRASNLAYRAVAEFGLDEEFGLLSLADVPDARERGSEALTRARVWISEAAERCRKLLEEDRDTLERLADILLDEETIDGARVDEIIGLQRLP
ncbi:MAG: AAA family ATPase [Candidatus Sumerlaeota bacterium]|nr:AAA family ATPase [Candidatus Sumerlaeota bacterium]